MTKSASKAIAAQNPIDYDLPCPKCEYNLRGLSSNRCPECGYALRESELAPAEIPWTRRRARGRIRAYCQTVWMITFRGRRMCNFADYHVDYHDAQRFRWVTVMIVYLPWLVLMGLLIALGEGDTMDFLEFGNALGVAATHAVIHGCILLFLAAATGVPSYFFHPRRLPVEVQNRGIALSYYMCGVLSWLLPAYVLLALGATITERFSSDKPLIYGLVIAGGTGALAWLRWLILEGKLSNRILGPSRAWTVWCLLAPLWILLAAVFLTVIPVMIFCMALMISSIT